MPEKLTRARLVFGIAGWITVVGIVFYAYHDYKAEQARESTSTPDTQPSESQSAEISNIYGNWGQRLWPNTCKDTIIVYRSDHWGLYNWNAMLAQISKPPVYARGEVSYQSRQGVIFVTATGNDGIRRLFAFKITSPTTMQSFEIIKPDGSTYGDWANKQFDWHHPPDVANVTISKSSVEFVRCGRETQKILADMGERTDK